MGALSPENFLSRLSDHREAFWEKLSAERKSYGAEKPLTPEIILRRLQFGVVMERKAAEVSAPWVSRLPELELQHCLSEYVANELKHASILRKGLQSSMAILTPCGIIPLRNSSNFGIFIPLWALFASCLQVSSMVMRSFFLGPQSRSSSVLSPLIRRRHRFIEIRC